MNETVPSPGSEGPDQRRSRAPHQPSRRRGAWSWCVSVTTTVGVLCSIAAWGWRGPAAGVVSIGVLAGTIATSAWAGDGWRAVPRIARLSLVAGLLGTAAAGLVAVFGIPGLVLVLVLAGTSPVTRMLVRALRPGTDVVAVTQPRPPATSLASSYADIAPIRRPVGPMGDLNDLDDDALCLAWRRSFVLLQGARSASDRLMIVEQRQQYLDELHRRSPSGLDTWLTSGGRASGNPLPYLGKDRPRPPE